jgi:hypothetical protein
MDTPKANLPYSVTPPTTHTYTYITYLSIYPSIYQVGHPIHLPGCVGRLAHIAHRFSPHSGVYYFFVCFYMYPTPLT